MGQGGLGAALPNRIAFHAVSASCAMRQVRPQTHFQRQDISREHTRPTRGPKALKFSDRVYDILMSSLDVFDSAGDPCVIELPLEWSSRLANVRVVHRDRSHTVCEARLQDEARTKVAVKIYRSGDQETLCTARHRTAYIMKRLGMMRHWEAGRPMLQLRRFLGSVRTMVRSGKRARCDAMVAEALAPTWVHTLVLKRIAHVLRASAEDAPLMDHAQVHRVLESVSALSLALAVTPSRTFLNLWTTSQRVHDGVRDRCLWGCDADDSLDR